jgi:hypothetical protein
MAKVKTRTIQAVATALRRAGVADSEIEATLKTLGLAPHIPEPDKKARKLIRTAAQVAAAQPGVWRVDGATGLYIGKSSPTQAPISSAIGSAVPVAPCA